MYFRNHFRHGWRQLRTRPALTGLDGGDQRVRLRLLVHFPSVGAGEGHVRASRCVKGPCRPRSVEFRRHFRHPGRRPASVHRHCAVRAGGQPSGDLLSLQSHCPAAGLTGDLHGCAPVHGILQTDQRLIRRPGEDLPVTAGALQVEGGLSRLQSWPSDRRRSPQPESPPVLPAPPGNRYPSRKRRPRPRPFP